MCVGEPRLLRNVGMPAHLSRHNLVSVLFPIHIGCASCIPGGSVPLLSDSSLNCCHCSILPCPFHGSHHSSSLPHRARAPTANQCGL